MRFLVLLALFVFPLAAAAKTPEPPKEGDKAPAFKALDEFKGKWVVLYFYPKDFTSGCTLEARGFQKALPEFEKRGAVIVGVSGQSAESHKSFCEKESLGFRLLADEDKAVSAAYGSVMNLGVAKLSARNTFLISPGGFVAKRWLKVSPGAHAAEVLAALDAAKAAK